MNFLVKKFNDTYKQTWNAECIKLLEIVVIQVRSNQ